MAEDDTEAPRQETTIEDVQEILERAMGKHLRLKLHLHLQENRQGVNLPRRLLVMTRSSMGCLEGFSQWC